MEEFISYQEDSIEYALRLAITYHSGQKDKSGNIFVMHPIRVAAKLRPDSPSYMICAAILHDIVEDTLMELESLKSAGFSDRTISLVNALTRRDDETYKEYIMRIAFTSTEAVELKLADLADNMDPRRASSHEIKGMIRNRYVWAREYLLQYI